MSNIRWSKPLLRLIRPIYISKESENVVRDLKSTGVLQLRLQQHICLESLCVYKCVTSKTFLCLQPTHFPARNEKEFYSYVLNRWVTQTNRTDMKGRWAQIDSRYQLGWSSVMREASSWSKVCLPLLQDAATSKSSWCVSPNKFDRSKAITEDGNEVMFEKVRSTTEIASRARQELAMSWTHM